MRFTIIVKVFKIHFFKEVAYKGFLYSFVGCLRYNEDIKKVGDPMVKTISVFSWFDTPFMEPEKTCALLAKYKITHLYQMVSPKLTSQQIQYF